MNTIFSVLLLLVAFCRSSYSLTYTYPVKCLNLDKAPEASRYTGLDPENNWEPSLIDPHAVHGITASDGSHILVGRAQSATGYDAFAVKVSPTGQTSWTWRSASSGKDAANAVVEIPGSGLLTIVGWRTVGSVGKRSLTVLSLSTGLEQYTTTSFGDAAGSHGAFEMVSVNSNSIVLSGVYKKPDLSEMNFKSYGNVVSGKAFVQSLPISQLQTGQVSWTKEFSDYTTAKSAEVLPSGKIAILVWSEEEGKSASTALLNANGSVQWITKHSQHGEGTDITVSDDGDWIIITGQGGNGYIAGRLTKVKVSDGSSVWTKDFTVGGNPNLIYQECWGVIATSDGFVVSCGAGIEGGKCSMVSGQDRTDCNEGRGDRRNGAFLRKENNWQSFVFKTDLDGNTLWQRVDSYKCDDCASMNSASFDSTNTGSSAAEWISKGNVDGEYLIITDEGFGVGALILTGDGSVSTPTNAPIPQPTLEPTPMPTIVPTPQPTPQPTNEPNSQPTPVPTPQPTPQRTTDPTLPPPTPVPTPQPTPQQTTDPTLPPVEEPSEDDCTEDPEAKFIVKRNGKKNLKRKCKWLEEQPDRRIRNYCKKKKGTKKRDPPKVACRITCEICEPDKDEEEEEDSGDNNSD